MPQHARAFSLRSGCLAVGLLCCAFSAQAQSLDQLIRKSLQSHPSVRSQQQQLEAAATEVSAARQQFLPVPSVSMERVSHGAVDPQYMGQSTVTVWRLQQPVWTGGRLTASLDKAQANAAMSQSALDEARLQLSLKVVSAWGDWYNASMRWSAHESSYKTHQRLLQQVGQRVQEGASAAAELELTRGRLAQTLAMRETVRQQQQMALARLALLIGEPLPPGAQPIESLRPPPGPVDQLMAQTLDASPVLQRLRHQQSVLNADVAEKKSNLYPELSLRAEHQRGNYAYANLPAVNRVFFTLNSKLGAGVSSWDLVKAAEQKKQALESDLLAQQLALNEQVESDWLQWQSVIQRKPMLQQSLDAARHTADSWDRQFMAGRKTWQEVLNAARELLQAEIEMGDVLVAQSVLKWRLMINSQGVDATLEQVHPGGQP
jgi:adhesin transport system outer membrane protein